MKSEELLRAMTEIRDAYVEEADPAESGLVLLTLLRRRRRWTQGVIGVAAAVLALSVGIGSMRYARVTSEVPKQEADAGTAAEAEMEPFMAVGSMKEEQAAEEDVAEEAVAEEAAVEEVAVEEVAVDEAEVEENAEDEAAADENAAEASAGAEGDIEAGGEAGRTPAAFPGGVLPAVAVIAFLMSFVLLLRRILGRRPPKS